MNRIFIEAKNNKTSEFHFLKAILNRFFPDKEVGFIFMDGIDNPLFFVSGQSVGRRCGDVDGMCCKA